MKTLYLTDLDGTLLNNSAAVSQTTAQILNKLIDKGMLFTVATARTYSTVIPMMKDVKLNLPLVLMNGVCIYDIVSSKTVDIKNIDTKAGTEIVDAFEKNEKYPMVYFEKDGIIRVEYKILTTKSQQNYVANRKKFYKKEFVKTENFSLDKAQNLIYIVTLDKKDEVQHIFDYAKKRDDVSANFYPDNYCDEYFLEIFSKDASKASGALKVKEITGADKIVAFGDNLNDLALFEIADEAYAVTNACDELKNAATGIIDSNENDAVAKFLLQRYENGEL